jgi:hypothetical protein
MSTGGPGAKFDGRDAPDKREEEWFKEFLESDPDAQDIAEANGLNLEHAHLYTSWNADPDACAPAFRKMVNSATVDCCCTLCAIIDVVGVGLDRMAWVLWMGYGTQDISPVSMDNCPRMILNAWQKAQVIDLTCDDV